MISCRGFVAWEASQKERTVPRPRPPPPSAPMWLCCWNSSSGYLHDHLCRENSAEPLRWWPPQTTLIFWQYWFEANPPSHLFWSNTASPAWWRYRFEHLPLKQFFADFRRCRYLCKSGNWNGLGPSQGPLYLVLHRFITSVYFLC